MHFLKGFWQKIKGNLFYIVIKNHFLYPTEKDAKKIVEKVYGIDLGKLEGQQLEFDL